MDPLPEAKRSKIVEGLLLRLLLGPAGLGGLLGDLALLLVGEFLGPGLAAEAAEGNSCWILLSGKIGHV